MVAVVAVARYIHVAFAVAEYARAAEHVRINFASPAPSQELGCSACQYLERMEGMTYAYDGAMRGFACL